MARLSAPRAYNLQREVPHRAIGIGHEGGSVRAYMRWPVSSSVRYTARSDGTPLRSGKGQLNLGIGQVGLDGRSRPWPLRLPPDVMGQQFAARAGEVYVYATGNLRRSLHAIALRVRAGADTRRAVTSASRRARPMGSSQPPSETSACAVGPLTSDAALTPTGAAIFSALTARPHGTTRLPDLEEVACRIDKAWPRSSAPADAGS